MARTFPSIDRQGQLLLSSKPNWDTATAAPLPPQVRVWISSHSTNR